MIKTSEFSFLNSSQEAYIQAVKLDKLKKGK